jgi:hypothetical protein
MIFYNIMPKAKIHSFSAFIDLIQILHSNETHSTHSMRVAKQSSTQTLEISKLQTSLTKDNKIGLRSHLNHNGHGPDNFPVALIPLLVPIDVNA